MIHFEQTAAGLWTAIERGEVIGTIRKIAHGYDVQIPSEGYRWTWETLNAAQDAFLPNE